jgi:hypothetical protein
VFRAAVRTSVMMSSECRSPAIHDGPEHFPMLQRKSMRAEIVRHSRA